MSEENVEIVRRGIELFNAGDYDGAAALLADDVVWYPRVALVEQGGPLVGRDAVAGAWRDQSAIFGGQENFQVTVRSIEAVGGGTVLVEQEMTATGTASGAAVRDTFTLVFTFRHGLPVRVESYDTRAEALTDLGSPTSG